MTTPPSTTRTNRSTGIVSDQRLKACERWVLNFLVFTVSELSNASLSSLLARRISDPYRAPPTAEFIRPASNLNTTSIHPRQFESLRNVVFRGREERDDTNQELHMFRVRLLSTDSFGPFFKPSQVIIESWSSLPRADTYDGFEDLLNRNLGSL